MSRPGESYTTRISIEEVFSRKLEALCARIRDIVYSGLVYVVSNEYSCKYCKCRILVRGNEKVYCPRCKVVPFWSAETQALVAQLLQSYPTLAECQVERRPQQPRDIPPENVAFGARIEEARLELGWTQNQLAAQVKKNNGGCLAVSTITAIEKGQGCSKEVKEQLERVLRLREGIAV